MIRQNGFGYSEQEKELNWAAAHAKREIEKHKNESPIDHPDRSVTRNKLSDELNDTINKIPEIKKELSDKITAEETVRKAYDDTLQENIDQLRNDFEIRTLTYTGYYPYFNDDIPLNKFFYLKNESSSTVSKVYVNDETGYILSESINAGDSRMCIATKKYVAGADIEWGFIYLVPLSDHIKAEKTARQQADTALQNKITAEESARTEADNEINENISTITDKLKNIDVLEAENAVDEAYFGEILKVINPEDETVFSEIKIRRERDVDNKYPNAKMMSDEAFYVGDICFSENMGGTVTGFDYVDYGYDIVNPMTLPTNSKAYFRVIEECVSTIDGHTPGKVGIIDVYSWHDAMYIRTDQTEDYTKIASQADVDKLRQELGAMSAALDAINGE